MIRLSTKRDCGLSLIEICVVLGFLSLFAALSLTSLKSGKDKAPTRGMAYALVEEFRAARQLAIANGHPVAVAIPTDGGSKASTSIFRLSGWNVPKVEWARDYSSEYPGVSFAASRFSTYRYCLKPAARRAAMPPPSSRPRNSSNAPAFWRAQA